MAAVHHTCGMPRNYVVYLHASAIHVQDAHCMHMTLQRWCYTVYTCHTLLSRFQRGCTFPYTCCQVWLSYCDCHFPHAAHTEKVPFLTENCSAQPITCQSSWCPKRRLLAATWRYNENILAIHPLYSLLTDFGRSLLCIPSIPCKISGHYKPAQHTFSWRVSSPR